MTIWFSKSIGQCRMSILKGFSALDKGESRYNDLKEVLSLVENPVAIDTWIVSHKSPVGIFNFVMNVWIYAILEYNWLEEVYFRWWI